MRLNKRFFVFFVVAIVLIQNSLNFTACSAEQPCPIPGVEETVIELCREGQTEIPRGNCLEICIRGKMENDSLSLSLDQTVGSGFHFEMDNGPTSIETTESRILICSDSTSCGSATIIMNMNGVSTEIGSIRSDYGYWIIKDNECFLSGPKTHMEGDVYVIERGGHKMMQWFDESWSMGAMAFDYRYYCENGDYDCASRCNTSSFCDSVVGCLECIEFEGYPTWDGDFPCKDNHHPCGGEYLCSSLKCFCTVRLQHKIFKCTNY